MRRPMPPGPALAVPAAASADIARRPDAADKDEDEKGVRESIFREGRLSICTSLSLFF